MSDEPRWLEPEELDTFRVFMQAAWGLPDYLNGELQTEDSLSFKEYFVLASLAEAPDDRVRMSRLALRVNSELSRLSHMVKRLENRGLVRREVDPTDGRFIDAVLTDEGRSVQAAAAPGHVRRVRAQFVDVLSAAELRALHRSTQKIVDALEKTIDRPPPR